MRRCKQCGGELPETYSPKRNYCALHNWDTHNKQMIREAREDNGLSVMKHQILELQQRYNFLWGIMIKFMEREYGTSTTTNQDDSKGV